MAPDVPPGDPPADGLRRLDRRVITVWWLVVAMWLVGAAIATAVVALATGSVVALATGLAAVALGAVVAAAMIPARYARFGYVFAPEALELQHGLWWRTRAAVPYHRIQHVDIEQGPIQRRLGLVSLELRTAAASSVGGLPGLANDEADALRAWLIARAADADGT